MLHILLFILKVIGIILAVILGILVLLLCVVLFVPIRYQGQAKSDGTIESMEADIKITWFLHLIKIVIAYKKGSLDYNIRIAWKNIPEEGEEKNEENSEEDNERVNQKESIAEEEKAVSEIRKEYEGISKEIEEEPRLSERLEQKPEEDGETVEEEKAGNQPHSEEVEKTSRSFYEKVKKIGGRVKEIFRSAGQVVEKIKCTFEKICDKIKLLLQQKDRVVEFIQDDTHTAAFQRTKSAVFKLLRRMKPRKLRADIHFGFEDPYRTGQVLAGLGLVYPFIGGCTNICPDFENRVLEGSAYVKGTIYMFRFAVLLWNLVWSKEVRTTFKDIRAFKL